MSQESHIVLSILSRFVIRASNHAVRNQCFLLVSLLVCHIFFESMGDEVTLLASFSMRWKVNR